MYNRSEGGFTVTVYIDEVFLINFMTDCVLLFTVKHILKNKDKNYRLWLSAVLMSLYSVCVVFTGSNPVITLAVPLFIIPICFSLHRFLEYLRYISAFYGTVFVFGGCATAAVNLLGMFSYKILLFSVFIGYVIFNFTRRDIRRITVKEQSKVKITLYKDGKEANIPSIVDTGNSLYDNISGLPVIVTDFEQVKDLLPENICNAFRINKDPIEIFAMAPLELRLIPFNSVGNKHGRIVGFKVDKILIDGAETEAIIGVSPEPVSLDMEYRGLVNPLVCV